MKILVTGGAGYIGSILVPALLNAEHEVIVLDNFMFRQNSLSDCAYHPNFNVIRGDCRNRELMKKLTHDVDIVIPLAALVGAPLCKLDSLTTEAVNFKAIEMLCEILEKEQRILMPVTNSGYGIGESGKFCTEETPLRPISEYGRTKVAAEKVVLDRGNSITFRLATVFGMSPRMRIDLLVNDFVYRAVNDKAVIIFEGHFKRNYIHIRDIARVMLHGIEHFDAMKGKPYNVGLEDANLSKIELCKEIQRHIPEFMFIEADIGEDPDKRDYIVSNQRILSTGFTMKYSLSDGIVELMKGYTIIKNNLFANI